MLYDSDAKSPKHNLFLYFSSRVIQCQLREKDQTIISLEALFKLLFCLFSWFRIEWDIISECVLQVSENKSESDYCVKQVTNRYKYWLIYNISVLFREKSVVNFLPFLHIVLQCDNIYQRQYIIFYFVGLSLSESSKLAPIFTEFSSKTLLC